MTLTKEWLSIGSAIIVLLRKTKRGLLRLLMHPISFAGEEFAFTPMKNVLEA
jgi:hypothetical protein